MSVIDFENFINQLAELSGNTILPFFKSTINIEQKSSAIEFDPVTEADHAAETVMRNLIKQHFPDHGIIGEEFGDENADADFVWILDPIDGTKAFILGFPLWGTLIGLIKENYPIFGMMHQPFTKEKFFGDGKASSYTGPKGKYSLHTRKDISLAQAIITTTSPRLMQEGHLKKFQKVEEKARLSRYGGDCYAYCMLAAGQIDAIIETDLKNYDILPLIPIIKGAGGIITNWQGEEVTKGGNIIAAGNKPLHNQIVAMLADE